MNPHSSFRYDAENHKYFLGQKEIVGVTDLLKNNGCYPHVRYATDEHRWRGEQVHEMMRLLHKGTLDTNSLDPLIIPYHQSWNKLRSDTGIVVLGFETPMGHPTFQYGGTPDLWGMVGKEFWILDYKTGKAPRVTGLQLSGYKGLLLVNGCIDTSRPIRRMGLELRPDGNYSLTPFDDDKDDSIFMMMVSTHNWRINNVNKNIKIC